MGVSTRLEDIVFEENKNEIKFFSCSTPINSIKISAKSLEKLFIMAEEMKTVHGSNLEVYALLIGNDEHIVTDICIPPQEVTHVNILVTEQDMVKIKEEIRGKKILGWGHSHCDFGVFFSGTDDRNQKNIFNETANYVDTKYGDFVFRVKYVYGMTVNIRREMYGEITIQYPCRKIDNKKDVTIEIIGDLNDFDEETERENIRSILKERVRVRVYRPQSYHIPVYHDIYTRNSNMHSSYSNPHIRNMYTYNVTRNKPRNKYIDDDIFTFDDFDFDYDYHNYYDYYELSMKLESFLDQIKGSRRYKRKVESIINDFIKYVLSD